MVYCGKASQGCKNCRIRRIKCDKVKPECSQCIRVGKKCPGYRDQLSLMFRDESSKVIQKAHAQWRVNEAEDGSYPQSSSAASSTGPSTSTSPYATTTWTTTPISDNHQHKSPPTPVSPDSSKIASSTQVVLDSSWSPQLCLPIGATIEEQGVSFYVDRYLIGHPDEPKTANELSQAEWLGSPTLQDIMIAVGVASMSHIKRDRSLMITARQKYGQALRQVGALLKAPIVPDFDVTMKAVVMLALFEMVKGTTQDIKIVHAHVIGGVALLRSWCPMPNVPFGGIRSLIQLCYCMFIPAHLGGLPLAAEFYEWVSFSRTHLDPVDHAAIDLGLLVARFVDLSAFIQAHDVRDSPPKTTSTVHQLLELDAAFADWEAGLGEIWPYRTTRAKHLPYAAAFDQEYHVYYDMWTARMWGHYRWARILINQTILELVEKHSQGNSPLLSEAEYKHCNMVIRQQARDTLVSTPSHWRHPLLDDKSPIPVEKFGGAGSGAAGIPVVLFQLKAAACAPGLPGEYWDWAYGIMECIWGDLGMLHAKVMMDAMIVYRDSLHHVRTASSSPSENQDSPSSRK